MDNQTLRILLDKLNAHCGLALEAAAGFAAARGQYEITIEHLLLKLMEEGQKGHFDCIIEHFEVDQDSLWQQLLENIHQQRGGNQGKPVMSPLLYQMLEKACLANSLHYAPDIIDSAGILDAVIQMAMTLPRHQAFRALDVVSLEALHQHFSRITADSSETAHRLGEGPSHGQPGQARAVASEAGTALDQFTIDLTAKAREGAMDPITGRNEEIRMAIDILCRRRKNNPILVGEPGVGKTAIVEGLAQKIVAGEVPELLRGIRLCVLDLGLLQAGAGVKGEFERRLKQVIDDVQNAPEPVMLFIDEAHTLVGAGGEAGKGDAANLLKPALARGELRTLAATTWSEYKQYFERDPALVRRFQLVKVEEPSTDAAILMLSGLKKRYEHHHGVMITDDAIETAVTYSQRYITGRYLPDKAIDLIDTAAARVKLGQAIAPQSLETLQARIDYLSARIQTLNSERAQGLSIHTEVLDRLQQELKEASSEQEALTTQWQQQSDLVKAIRKDSDTLQQYLSQHSNDTLDADDTLAGMIDISQLRRQTLARIQAERPMVQPEVNSLAIADVVADWTGIPVGSMVKDELQNLLQFEQKLGEGIVGQDGAIATIGKTLRASKAGLRTSEGPLGVFLLAGPSGVGKTETARALARQLFGSEKALISINMSEYQEAHTVSQLKGSPPGYVGYGEGGILTEAVRQRPYSVVLLDEAEKAHLDVMNLFYQVFDRGFMRDGEGREIDFTNTVILLTSNLGAEAIQRRFEPPEVTVEAKLEPDQDIAEATEAPDTPETNPETEHDEPEWAPPSYSELVDLVRPEVLRHFAPALVARMQIVPFNSLSEQALSAVVALKLDQLAQRLHQQHGLEVQCTEAVMAHLAAQCRLNDSGARHVNALLEQQLMPALASQILGYLAEEDMPDILRLDYQDDEGLVCTFADRAPNHTASQDQAVPAETEEPLGVPQ